MIFERRMDNASPPRLAEDMGQLSRHGGGGNAHIVHSSGVQVSATGPPSPATEDNNNNNININNNGNNLKAAANKKAGRYKECLKNHAAAIGGNAVDGCGEFMPGGEEGSLEALKCSACNCHRNFHRKEAEISDHYPLDCYHSPFLNNGSRRPIIGTPHPHQNFIPPPSPPPQTAVIFSRHGRLQALTGYQGGSIPSETDEKEIGKVTKRFRTKFTKDQKEKMLRFAEKAEWRIQKLDESVVQQFCQEIGIKRRVLKVWMHNNKQSYLSKKDHISAASNID